MKIVTASDGTVNLHIWRTGESYFRQKSPVFLKEWNNVKLSVLPYPPRPEILHHDVRRPLPYPDETFDSVFALHIIEHLTTEEGQRFLLDVRRMLKPGGILRISTPDLENIVREYLQRLDQCLERSSPENTLKYDWSVLELLDQMVRDTSGGLMRERVKQGYYDPDYAHERYGDVFAEFCVSPTQAAHPVQNQSLTERIRSKTPGKLFRAVVWRIENCLYRYRRKLALIRLRGDPQKTLEINKWMYDRLSLRLLLEDTGFVEFSVKSHKESDIANWHTYNLDQSNDGDHPIEPSLYVEARNPGRNSKAA